MRTVRELIQALVLNCDLDDVVNVEFKIPVENKDDSFVYHREDVRRVFHCADGEALIECHND